MATKDEFKDRISYIFAKVAFSHGSANIAVQGIESEMARYNEDVRKLKNDRRAETNNS